jgi:hypothetical protein
MEGEQVGGKNATSRRIGCSRRIVGVGLGLILGALVGIIVGLVAGVGIAMLLGVL